MKNKLEIEKSFGNIKNLLHSKLYSSSSTYTIKQLHGSLKSLLISSLYTNEKKPVLIIASDKQKADDYYHDLTSLHEQIPISYLVNPHHSRNAIISDDDLSYWLIDGLITLLKSDLPIIITTEEIFNLKMPSPDGVSSDIIKISTNQDIGFDSFTTGLMLNGFDRKDFVAQQGDIAIRGCIVDIYPINKDNPVRLEFFGDSIETIRTFDVISQRSIENHTDLEISNKIYHSEDEKQFNSNIFQFLNKDFLVFFDSPDKTIANEFISDLDKFKTIFINPFGESDFEISSVPQPYYNKSIKNFIELIQNIKDDYEIIIIAEGPNNLDRLKEIIDNNLNYEQENHSDLENRESIFDNVRWCQNSLSSGFISESLRVAVFTEHEIFGRNRIQDVRRGKRRKGGLTLKELKRLSIGDLIVHEDKGIGIFDGLETVQISGKYHESARLLFADNDKLFVHLNYIHKIQKYSAEEGVVPKLSKLGSGEWQRKKDRTKKRLKDIARELIALYAKRKASRGFAFPSDTPWQKEFEASFIYEDTPDQSKTNVEVKSDMESSTPMDRLVCGDVGFGKTEIAIRAAFKAVQANKQVAVLVPTTVLAQQHFLTFRDRFENFPVNVEVMSRFKSPAEQKIILSRTSEGKVDILIGTHRILSKDIKFKDFGLMIVDEEHRFGVGAKEKLKNLRENVDALTLTATPIPRTLNYSLMGVRDLSVIETPPRNRLPIETEIIEWNKEYLQKIIYYEINRRGQIFFVSDKIDDLELIKFDLQRIVPEIKYGIIHGQMPASEIEKTMENFIEKKIDLLLSTKIVESGLDIPNANTMIINRAQNFGLAELYQLRGRVGRSNTKAYCYLLIPSAKQLTDIAVKRLQAIEEFSDLGSGFQLALRDLEIRGAGNLLGPEQSGFINDIGFELYNKILDDAVRELKHGEFNDVFQDSLQDLSFLDNEEIQIETEFDALFPQDYIKSDKERFYYYKRLYNLSSFDELSRVITELEDKFGKPPKQVFELFFAVKLRIASLNTGFIKVAISGKILSVEFPPESNNIFYDRIFQEIIGEITSNNEAKLKQTGKKFVANFSLEKREQAIDILWRLKKFIQSLVND